MSSPFIEYYNIVMSIASAVLNIYYFFTIAKEHWKWLKLMYGLNSILVLAFTVQSLLLVDIQGARAAILISTIVAGSVVSFIRNKAARNGNNGNSNSLR